MLTIVFLILSIAMLVMFIIMFIKVIEIRQFQKEILESGGYPTVMYYRAKQEAREILAETYVFSTDRVDELIRMLSELPHDPEAASLIQSLNQMKEAESNRNRNIQ